MTDLLSEKSSASLPKPHNRCFGREIDVRTLCAMLRGSASWVTLSATGGAGKTRLAIEIAHTMLAEFTDGVYFIEFEPVFDPALVLPTVAAALEIVENGPSLAESLRDFLRDRHMLLIFDNMEQVAEGAAQLQNLIVAAPGICVLATSRQPLNVPTEHVYPLELLPTPDLRRQPALSELAENPAVAIFMQRAQFVKPDCRLSDVNATAIAGICTRLEGLPLAIELAASRIRQFPPEEMLAHLDQSLKVLTRGGRNLTERQQTLYGLIEWSYNLLSVGEQALFARLGIFAGGCTTAAAATVCVIDDDLSIGVSDGLTQLVEKNLIRRIVNNDGEPRYTMLHTIREYARFALQRLAPEGEKSLIEEQHQTYFVALACTAAPELTGPRQDEWLLRLERDHDNMRQVLRQAIDTPDAPTALMLSAALWRFWYMRGQYSEGRQWLTEALALAADDSLRAPALHGAGLLSYCQGDYVQAETALREAVTLARAQDSTALLSAALNALGIVSQMQGRYEHAVAAFEEGLVLARAAAAKREIANLLSNLAWVREKQNAYAQAGSLYDESLTLYQELGDTYATANAELNLGWLAFRQNRNDSARGATERALAMYTAIDDAGGLAAARHNLAWIALAQADSTHAATLYHQSLSQFREVGDQKSIAECMAGLGIIAAQQAQNEEAIKFWAGAAAILRIVDSPMDPGIYERQVQSMAAVKESVGQNTWAKTWEEGETMPLDALITTKLFQA